MATQTENTVEVAMEPLDSPQAPRGNSIPDHEMTAGNAAIQTLKPVDRGRDAWAVLIAGFVFEALFWGFPMCFGVFQNYYSNLPQFQPSKSNIAVVGTLAQGLYYLGAPLSAALTKRFPGHQKLQIWIGWPLCISGLLAASFVSSVPALIATQGLLYGLGFVILTYPILSMLNEWWVARKGMAFGLISASSGATGAVMPFIIEALLSKYGYRITLRACAVAMLVLTGPLIPLFRGRLPVSSVAASFARADAEFLRKPLFWVYGLAILVQGMGFFLPVVFLPSYASDAGLPAWNGALLLAVMSVSQVFGQFAFGYLSDRGIHVSIFSTIACLGAAVATLALWGVGKTLPVLILFAVGYGIFGFGFGTLRVAMGRAVCENQSGVFATYAIFVFAQGLGNVLVGPLSAALISSNESQRGQYAVGKYRGVVLLTGGSSLLAAFIIVTGHAFSKLRF